MSVFRESFNLISFCDLLPILKCLGLMMQEEKNQASSQLDAIYDEIRPAIEEHERDSQDSVPTDVAKKWIGANCSKMKADFNLYSSIIRNIVCTPRRPPGEAKASAGGDNENETKDLTT